jgi:hypothetical protein
MAKTIVVTPVYFSFAWILMTTYQLFTETAVKTIVQETLQIWPILGNILNIQIDMLVFIVAFSWIFLLTSVIPSLLLGKKGSTLVQFIIVLLLTSTTLNIQDLFIQFTELDISKIFSFTNYLMNPFIAFTYLFLPYLVMLIVDLDKKH